MTTAADKLAAATSVPEPKDVMYPFEAKMWNYQNGSPYETWDFNEQVTAVRVNLNTAAASTLEVDLQDSDFSVLSTPLFAHWAFGIRDVSLDSKRQFNSKRLTFNTDNTYLGDESDLEWILGQRPIDLLYGGVYFRLCAITSSQTTVTLQFEDRSASKLRNQSGPLAWNRSHHTRAQFIAMLCRQAGVESFIPELDIRQPIVIDQTTAGATTTTQVTGKGIAKDANLTVKGHPMNATQRKVAGIICQIGDKLKAPAVAVEAVLFDAIYESGLGMALVNPTSQYGGILGGSDQYFTRDLDSASAMATAAFLGGKGFTSAIDLAKTHNHIAVIGSQCTRAVPYDNEGISRQYETENVPGGVQGVAAEAEAIYLAYGGPGTTSSSVSTSTASGTYQFTRGANEDSWDCIQRLASEVGWYAFVRQNRLWFVSGNYLFQQESQIIAECGENGVRYIDVDLDMGARDSTAEVDIYAAADTWAALPGMVVSVRNRGPATGKWMVSQVQAQPRSPDQLTQITCYKPIPKQSEPISSADSSAASTTTTGLNLSSGQGTAMAAYQAAKALSDKGLIYTEHVRTLLPLSQVPKGATMFDCSSSVSEVLLLAGFALPDGATFGAWAPTTTGFVVGGAGGKLRSGPGQQMTIWCNPASHVFIEFNIPGVGHFQANTDCENNNAGFRVAPWGPMGSTDAASGSFIPLHYAGT